MKIQSRFKDYYDIAMSQGTQDDIFFDRKIINSLVKCDDYKKYSDLESLSIDMYRHLRENSDTLHISRLFNLTPFMVAFCGKVYPGVRVQRQHGTLISIEENIDSYFYDLESLEACLSKQKTSLKEAKVDRWSAFLSKRENKSLSNFFEVKGSKQFENSLLHNKVMTAVVSLFPNNEGSHFTVNLPLKDVEFFKVFDCYQAYQELSMYIGGVLAPESKPMIQIEDKYRVIAHGFDKMSFRKAPTKYR